MNKSIYNYVKICTLLLTVEKLTKRAALNVQQNSFFIVASRITL